MNWKRTILCALGTALLVTGGFLLPKAVFVYQDYRFDQADATTLTQPFQVQATSQLSQSLLLAGNLNDNVTLETSQAQRSKKEVKTLAMDALELLNTCYQDILNLDKLTYSANPENVASLSGNPRHIFVMATSAMQRLWSIPSMPIGTTPWSTLPPKAIWTIPFSTRKPFCVYQCPRNPHAFAHCQSLME